MVSMAPWASASGLHCSDERLDELHVLPRLMHCSSARIGAIPPDRSLLVGAPVDIDVAAPPFGGVEVAESQSPVFQPVRYPCSAVFEGSPSRYAAWCAWTWIGDLDRSSIRNLSGHGSGLNEGLDAFPLCVRCCRVSVPVHPFSPKAGGCRVRTLRPCTKEAADDSIR